VTLKGDASQP
jgi:hypothetical protein